MQSSARLLRALKEPGPQVTARLHDVYGDDADVVRARIELTRRVLEAFAARHGPERPVRLFRAPARINLRGMHVDTHGGYLNLMTHQREVVIAAAPRDDGRCRAENIAHGVEPVEFAVDDWLGTPEFARDWLAFIDTPRVRRSVAEESPGWMRYIRGAALSAQIGRAHV